MKEEILSIASDLREGSMTTNEAKEQLLLLFGVMGQLPTGIGCLHDWTQLSLQWNKCWKCGMFVPVGNLP